MLNHYFKPDLDLDKNTGQYGSKTRTTFSPAVDQSAVPSQVWMTVDVLLKMGHGQHSVFFSLKVIASFSR